MKCTSAVFYQISPEHVMWCGKRGF